MMLRVRVQRDDAVQRDGVPREEPRADDLSPLVPPEGGELVVDGVIDERLQVGDAHLGVVADERAPQRVDAAGAGDQGRLGLR